MLELKPVQLPESWITQGAQYQYHAETDDTGSDCGWVSCDEELPHDGIVRKRLRAEPFLNKRIRLVGFCRSANVSKRAGLLVRTERRNGTYITLDNMVDRPLVGTADWQRCELVIDVPSDTDSIWIGAQLRGSGQVWFKELVLEVVADEVPTTDQYAIGCVGIWDLEPVNLDFTQDELPELRLDRPYISEARRWVITSDDDDAAYEFIRKSEVLFDNKPSALLKSESNVGTGYLYQHFAAARFRNKRIRFSAMIKTRLAEKGTWLLVNAFDYDNNDLVWKYSERCVTGTADWMQLEVDIDVPREAFVIDIGICMSGAGEAYLAGLKVEVLGEVQEEQLELLPGIGLHDPDDSRWIMTRARNIRTIPGMPGRGIQLDAVRPGPQMRSSAGVRLSCIPVERELRLSCLLRGSRSGQKLKVYIYAYDGAGKKVRASVLHVSLDHKGWAPFETTFVAPIDTTQLNVWFFNFAGQSAYITQPSLRSGSRVETVPDYNTDYNAPSERGATKVIEAHYKAAVRAIKDGDVGSITFPIPGPYRDQVPLTFTVETKPKAALLGYEIKKREDGINWVAEVKLKPPAKGVVISWDSLVLIRGQVETLLPHSTPEAPPHAAPWLQSTKCVQCSDEEITRKAEELGHKSSDLESFVQNVIQFTSKNRGKKGYEFDSLDAKTAIRTGGSCTSRANLAAALLRARGIPARTVSHLPSWMRSYFFEHWLVEYWHPGVGWVWIEPTLNEMQPAANEVVVLAVSSPDDENKCDDPVHLRYLMPGGAYLSGCELSEELVAASIMKRATAPNIAIEQAEIRGTDSDLDNLFEIALQKFQILSAQRSYKDQSENRTEELRRAVYEGDAVKLADCLRGTESRLPKCTISRT